MKSFTAESITEDLRRTGVCNIPGVGKFSVKQREARQGRNPQTGEPIAIAAKKAVGFTPSSVLKKALN